jgi:hypothetical protein
VSAVALPVYSLRARLHLRLFLRGFAMASASDIVPQMVLGRSFIVDKKEAESLCYTVQDAHAVPCGEGALRFTHRYLACAGPAGLFQLPALFVRPGTLPVNQRHFLACAHESHRLANNHPALT